MQEIGLGEVAPHWVLDWMGEFVSRLGEAVLVRLQESSVLWLSLLSTVASDHSSCLDYVPVFIDCTDIEVDEKYFEVAKLRNRVVRR